MDLPISTVGDSSPGKLQRGSSPASPNSAKSSVKATEARFSSVQHGEFEDGVHSQDSTKQELNPDSPEATNAGAQADVQEDGNSPNDDIKDDVSVASYTVRIQRSEQPYDYKDEHTERLVADYRRDGTKYARVASIYTEGLENRVGTLEREILELQYKFGSKEKPNEERQVISCIPVLRYVLFVF